jgi:glycerol-3-phosphate dehydrogenase
MLHPGVKYTATYFDASVHNPERLTLDVLQDGEKAGGRAGATTSPRVPSASNADRRTSTGKGSTLRLTN